MAYKNDNRLRRIIRIQEITLEHTKRGVTQEWVYQNVINPDYCISKTTFYKYLGMNAKATIKMPADKRPKATKNSFDWSRKRLKKDSDNGNSKID
jgi:hypothetical protein